MSKNGSSSKSKGLSENEELSGGFIMTDSEGRVSESDGYYGEEEDGEGKLSSTFESSEEPKKDVLLTKAVIRPLLSTIGRTVDNFHYAYIRFNGANLSLSNVDALSDYIHLRLLVLSENRIKNLLPLCSIKHLLVLNAHTNAISSFEDIPSWPYLQALSLMSNRLSSLKGLYANHITYLQLSFNGFDKLDDFNGSVFYALRTLELRGNQLTSLHGLSIPTLEHLFAAQNNLKDVSGLNCPNLISLHLRDNEIKFLKDFPLLPKLKSLNLRSNLVSRFTQTVHLEKAPELTVLILMDNPICGSELYRVEMLAVLPALVRIDKLLCPEVELIEGKQLRIGRQKNLADVIPLTDDPNTVTPPIVSHSGDEINGNEDEGEGGETGLVKQKSNLPMSSFEGQGLIL